MGETPCRVEDPLLDSWIEAFLKGELTSAQLSVSQREAIQVVLIERYLSSYRQPVVVSIQATPLRPPDAQRSPQPRLLGKFRRSRSPRITRKKDDHEHIDGSTEDFRRRTA